MSYIKTFIDELKELKNPYSSLEKLNNINDEQIQKDIKEHFRWNISDWIDLTVIMKDPNSYPQDRSFVLFPEQKDWIADWIQETAITETPRMDVKVYKKSRRVGWTNTFLAALTWAAIFWERSSIIGTKDFDSVDQKGNEDKSLLPRIRKILQFQPKYLVPDFRDPQGAILFDKASITGAATQNPSAASKFGRQERVRYALYDEAGFWESYNLRLAYNAASSTANYRILISSASESPTHFFEELYKGDIVDGVKGIWVPHSVNPANNDEWLEDYYKSNPRETVDQEVFGKPGGATARVIPRYFRESFEDENGLYTSDYHWIKAQLEKKGTYFLTFDAGAKSKTKAAVLGYRTEIDDRDILLKEFIKRDEEDLYTLCLEAKEFIDKHTDFEAILRLYGDPAISMYNDDKHIEEVFRKKVNLLDSLRRQGDYKPPEQFMGWYADRQTKRIAVLNKQLDSRCGDNKPKIICLSPDKDGVYGCPNLFVGMFEGGYQWAMRKGEIIRPNVLEQNHPIVDAVDAYSYYLLEEKKHSKRSDSGKILHRGVIR